MKTLPGYRSVLPRGVLAVVVALTAARASAQESRAPDAPASEARAHFDRGVSFYDETDYSAALVEFKRAYTLAPAWQVLFNIGQSYFQLRNYAQALVTLRRFVDEGGGRIPSDRRAVVDSESADLANRVGHASITSNTAGVTVTVDDEVVGTTPLAEPVLMSVGVRKVKAVRSRGPVTDPPVETEVSIPAGETVDVRLDFPDPPAPAPAADAASAPAPAVKAVEGPAHSMTAGRSRAPAFASIGVAVAGAAVGAVFGGLTLHDKSRLDAECAGKACPAGSRSDIDAVSRDGSLATVGVVAAAVGLTAGIVLWLTEGGAGASHVPVTSSRPIVLGPGLGPGFLAGTF